MTWRWPWVSGPRETRAAEPSDYTSMMLATAYGRAAGTGSDPSVLGALETAAGVWSRAFAAATVTGAPDVIARAVTPWMLSTVARSLIRAGESAVADRGRGRRGPAGTMRALGRTRPESKPGDLAHTRRSRCA